jgi:hypothetical protein
MRAPVLGNEQDLLLARSTPSRPFMGGRAAFRRESDGFAGRLIQ